MSIKGIKSQKADNRIRLLMTAFALAAMAPGHAHAAVCAPAPGGCCNTLGETAMTTGGTDVLACLHNMNGAAPPLVWYRAGTNSIPTCQAGYALNFDGTNFTCTVETVNFPTCSPDQALSYNGTSFVCVTPQPPPPPPPQCPFVNESDADCPPGYQGSIATITSQACDGSISQSTQNTCVPVGTLTTITQVTCIIGSTYYGTLVSGLFSACPGANDPSCRTYTCTANGLQ